MLDVVDEERSEIEVETEFTDDSFAQAYIKRRINTIYENELAVSELLELLSGLSDVDMLNIYPCWNKILCILKKDENSLEIFNDRIKKLINKIEYEKKSLYNMQKN